jgi:hypothetical protein
MKRLLLSCVLGVGAFCGAGCDVADGASDVDENVPPVARLIAPQLARVGEAARFDASASSDEDGDVVSFDLAFSDGTVVVDDDDGVFDHVFVAAGRVVVIVSVIDDAGDSADAEVEVVVVEGAIEGCDCDAVCLDDGICAGGDCVVVAASDNRAVTIDDVAACD